jgi:hypothetical protein
MIKIEHDVMFKKSSVVRGVLTVLRNAKNAYVIWRSEKEAKRDVEIFFASKIGVCGCDGVGTLFKHVEIETMNKCNGTCTFCPVNRNIDPRPLIRMSDDIFYKIIDNLVKLNYCGQVGYYSNNEPLMDNRIYDFIKYGVSKLPNVNHIIFTNGTLLDIDKFQLLMDSGLNCLYIDNYNDNYELNPNIIKIYDKYKNEKFPMDCRIYMRLNDEVLSNRGGSAPNKRKVGKSFKAPCDMPFLQLIIRADCGVSLCCNDALGKVTLGDVEKQTLEDIWYGQKHFEILESMRENIRSGICRDCDIVSSGKYYSAYM